MRQARRPSVAIHELAGHPFIVDLATELSARQWETDLIYCSSNLAPHGFAGDSGDVRVTDLKLRRPFEKYSLRKRVLQELELSIKLIRHLRRTKPDVLVSSCVPPITALVSTAWARANGIRTVLWIQDLQAGLAAKALADRGVIRRNMTALVRWTEMYTARLSTSNVVISADFIDELLQAGVDPAEVHVVPNWGPVSRVNVLHRDNTFSREYDLTETVNFIYSGTLAKKHNPEMLVALADSLRHDPRYQLVVVSQGVGADWLRAEAQARQLPNIRLLPFQTFERLPSVLASADVLLCLLELDAGRYSVPSKVLSYLCSGRPILASMPNTNQAARMLSSSQAGLVVAPGDERAFLAAARELAANPVLRMRMAAAARSYALEHFAVGPKADIIEQILAPGIRTTTPSIKAG